MIIYFLKYSAGIVGRGGLRSYGVNIAPWERSNERKRLDRGFLWWHIVATLQTIILGYMWFKKGKITRCMLSAPWALNTSVNLWYVSKTGARQREELTDRTQQRLLNTVKSIERLKESWWRTSVDVSVLHLRNNKCEIAGIRSEKRPSLWYVVLAIQSFLAGESADKLTLFLDVVRRKAPRQLTHFSPRRNDGSYADGNILSIVWMDAWLATLL